MDDIVGGHLDDLAKEIREANKEMLVNVLFALPWITCLIVLAELVKLFWNA